MFRSIRWKRFFLNTYFRRCVRKGIGSRCIYKTCSSQWEITSSILMSKSRVKTGDSTLKSTIQRLELYCAVFWLNLAKSIANDLKMNITKVIFWTDFFKVLYWIYNQSRLFKSFVENWVWKIQAQTEPSVWRYASTKSLPKITRWIAAKDIAYSNSRWIGPDFIGTTGDE